MPSEPEFGARLLRQLLGHDAVGDREMLGQFGVVPGRRVRQVHPLRPRQIWRGPGLASFGQGLEPACASAAADRQAWMADLADAGVFGPKDAEGFARSADWRTEADRILAARKTK